jgi:cytochrome c oxidase assembly factor CtaG
MLAGALVSPLHQAGERSFAAHMLEHELLMLPAAALLVLARPLGVMLWSLPGAARRATARAVKASGLVALHRALSEPVTATLLQTAVLWGWHAPALFDLALAHEGWHVAQHASFLVSALVFWSAMLHRARPGHAAVCLFATSVVGGALGALMAFSQSPWYARYAALGMAPFGLSATEDQQLAGLLMWVPGGVVHAAAALVLVARTLRDQPREADRVPAP